MTSMKIFCQTFFNIGYLVSITSNQYEKYSVCHLEILVSKSDYDVNENIVSVKQLSQ